MFLAALAALHHSTSEHFVHKINLLLQLQLQAEIECIIRMVEENPQAGIIREGDGDGSLEINLIKETYGNNVLIRFIYSILLKYYKMFFERRIRMRSERTLITLPTRRFHI